MNTSYTGFPSFRVLAASALATAAATVGLAAPAQADPRVYTTTVTIENQTSELFELVSQSTSEGVIDEYLKSKLPAYRSDWLKASADVDQGGTKGKVKYTAENGGYVIVTWNGPYDETAEYDCHVPDGLTCTWDANDDYEAEVTFTITPDE